MVVVLVVENIVRFLPTERHIGFETDGCSDKYHGATALKLYPRRCGYVSRLRATESSILYCKSRKSFARGPTNLMVAIDAVVNRRTVPRDGRILRTSNGRRVLKIAEKVLFGRAFDIVVVVVL